MRPYFDLQNFEHWHVLLTIDLRAGLVWDEFANAMGWDDCRVILNLPVFARFLAASLSNRQQLGTPKNRNARKHMAKFEFDLEWHVDTVDFAVALDHISMECAWHLQELNLEPIFSQ